MPNKVALVTGGSRGLGRAICASLAQQGFDVAINCRRNAPAAQETQAACEKLGVKAEIFQADVADYDATRQMIDAVIRQMGGLYGVIANAGITPGFGYVNETDPETWRRVIDVNVNGVFNTLHAAAPHLKAQGAGRMVAISSLATRYFNPGFGPYAASKVAVQGLVAVMGKEMAQWGVTVNAVAPGLFDTDMGRGLIDRIGEDAVKKSIPVQRLGRPEEVGDLCAFLLGDQAGFITSETYYISGGGRGIALQP